MEAPLLKVGDETTCVGHALGSNPIWEESDADGSHSSGDQNRTLGGLVAQGSISLDVVVHQVDVHSLVLDGGAAFRSGSLKGR